MSSKSVYSRKSNAILLIFIFFFSGFAALIYQVIWQRWLVFYTGISSVSISLIVSAFMAGLGLGYLFGGQIADRVPKNRPIFLFFLAELGIGAFALVSKYILYDWLYVGNILAGDSTFTNYSILFLVLLFPTFLMGLSLPLLSKSFEDKNSKNQASFISLLYFTNTLGAAIGTFVTSFVLIPKIGFEDAVRLGAALNFICALTALYVFFRTKKADNFKIGKQAFTAADIKIDFIWDKGFLFWILQYTLSGFMAISFEIIWFRMLDTMMKSYAVTFSIILTIYLGSMAVGTFVGVRLAKEIKGSKLRFFLKAQYFLYFYTAVSILILHLALTKIPALSPLMVFFKGYDTVNSFKINLMTMAIIPLFLMAIPTFIMGFSFTLSQLIIQDKFENVGRKVGWLQFMNIVGSTIGAWFVTLVGFNSLGSSLTIKLICVLGILYVFILFKDKRQNIFNYVIMVVLLFTTIFCIPSNATFWKNLSGVIEDKNFIFSEDETALSSIKIDNKISTVFVNGLGQSFLPMREDYVHIMLGALPLYIHPAPEDIAIIGLGSGCTLYNAGGRNITKQIDCFEVIVNQPKVLEEYVKRTNYDAPTRILNDKRVNMILKDGRYTLYNSSKKYDVIEADALRPKSAYSGNLYSEDYFKLLKSKLKKGGIAISWVPTERIRNGFTNVFPYVYEVVNTLFLGSETPLDFDKLKVLERLEKESLNDFYKKADVDINPILINCINTLKVIQTGKVSNKKEVNSDMWPKDEYDFRAELH